MLLHQLAVPAIILGFLLSTVHAAQRVYRCKAADGVALYQAVPCSNKEGAPLVLQDSRSGWIGLRKAERALLKKPASKSAEKSGRKSPEKKQRRGPVDTRACWSKRQSLKTVKARLHRGYKPAEGEKLRRKRREYEDYLRRFCS